VGAAALPPDTGQGRDDRGDQSGVGVGGDEAHAGEAAGDQVAEECQPAGAVLGGGDLHAEDLPVSVGVHPGRHQRMHRDHAAALSHLEHERVSGHERERAGLGQ
jgi:hypothetical protein